jgi:hypothetical protein
MQSACPSLASPAGPNWVNSLRGICGHGANRVVPPESENPPERGFPCGRYWARTSDPQLVDTEQTVAGVRSTFVTRCKSALSVSCLFAGVRFDRTLGVHTVHMDFRS